MRYRIRYLICSYQRSALVVLFKGMGRGALTSAKLAIFTYDGCRTPHRTKTIIFKMGFQSEVELLDVSLCGILCVVSMIYNILGRN
jgi:hypothetical protein